MAIGWCEEDEHARGRPLTSGRSADFRRLFNPPTTAAILAILDWKRVSGTSQVAQIDGKDLLLYFRGGPPKKKFTPQSHAEGPYLKIKKSAQRVANGGC